MSSVEQNPVDVPEQTISTLLSPHNVRGGRSFILEHGFWLKYYKKHITGRGCRLWHPGIREWQPLLDPTIINDVINIINSYIWYV